MKQVGAWMDESLYSIVKKAADIDNRNISNFLIISSKERAISILQNVGYSLDEINAVLDGG